MVRLGFRDRSSIRNVYPVERRAQEAARAQRRARLRAMNAAVHPLAWVVFLIVGVTAVITELDALPGIAIIGALLLWYQVLKAQQTRADNTEAKRHEGNDRLYRL